MKTEGPQGTKPRSFRRFVITALVLAVALPVGLAIARWRESVRIHKTNEWIRNTIQELAKTGPPSDDPGKTMPSPSWITRDHLIFSNGWAAYKIHTVHHGKEVGDIAILRLADNRYYSSKLHYCSGGLSSLLPRSDPDGIAPRPADAQDFLDNIGKRQQWNLLSPEGRLRCAIICPNADRRRTKRKVLWVSINTGDASGDTNLFERRYSFPGNHLAWKTHWNSDESLVLSVFDYAVSPMTRPSYHPEQRSNHLATLEFHRNKQTGRFTEKLP